MSEKHFMPLHSPVFNKNMGLPSRLAPSARRDLICLAILLGGSAALAAIPRLRDGLHWLLQ